MGDRGAVSDVDLLFLSAPSTFTQIDDGVLTGGGEGSRGVGPEASSQASSPSRSQARLVIVPVEVELKLTACPVRGEAGEYVKEADGRLRPGRGREDERTA